MSRGVMFFATREDLLRVLGRIERRVPLAYRAFVTNKPDYGPLDVPTWGSVSDLPNLGTAVEGSYSDQPTYLVMPTASPFTLWQRKIGEQTFRGVYPEGNPDSVLFHTGGVFEGTHLIIGEFSTGLPKPQTFDLFGAIRRAFKAECDWIPDSYIGSGARALADQGVRLVGSTRQPQEADFKLPANKKSSPESS